MGNVFFKLLNMSIAAGWLVLAVAALRLVFKKAPRWVFCVLWAMVALRLALPFSVQSPFSVVPSVNTVSVVTEPVSSDPVSVPDEYSAPQTAIPAEVSSPQGYVSPSEHSAPEEPVSRPAHTETDPSPVIPGTVDPAQTDNAHQQIQRIVIKTGIPAIDNTISAAETERAYTGEEQTGDIGAVLFWIWASGAALMASYAAFSYLRLRLRLRCSIKGADGAYVCDTIDTPFILGLFRPRIYVPSGMNGRERSYVLAHEKAHLRRFDHLWKPLGYLMLAAYWFNPLMWLAYIFFCRDIEIACDEKVVKTLDTESKAGYSQTLLDLNRPRRMISACPLAFGEVGVKERIKKVLSYKKPTLWILIAALLLTTVLAVCLMTDPKGRNGDEESSAEESSEEESSEEESSEEESSEEESVEDLEPTPDEYFTFTLLEDGTYEIAADRTKTMPEQLVLPSEHEGKPVTRIAKNAFNGITDMVSVIIPDSVVSIGRFAFSGCATKPPDLYPELYEESADIEAYEEKGLVSVTMTDSVTEIGAGAFASSFYLKEIRLSESITEIAARTFYYCRTLESAVIPEGVTQIGADAFTKCAALTKATLPESVVFIGKNAFSFCSALTEIVIPDSVVSIESFTFSYCSGLTGIVIPDSVVNIGLGAFDYCSGLTEIVIPENVESVGEFAFGFCESLTKIRVMNETIDFPANALDGCDQIIYNEYAGGLYIGDGANEYLLFVRPEDTAVASIDINPATKCIASNAFYKNENLVSVTLHEGLERIGSNAFLRCSNLTDVSIPQSVTEIGQSAFRCATSITQITVPDGVAVIEKAVFNSCIKVVTVTVPESVERINEEAFFNCASLKTVYLPMRLEHIGAKAFSRNTALAVIYYPGTAEQWNAITKADDWDEGTGAYTVICSDGPVTDDGPIENIPALEVSDFVSVGGGNIYYTCKTFPGKKAVIKTENTGGLATLKEFFVIDAECTDPGEEYLYRVYRGRRYTRSKDGSFDPKRTYAVVALQIAYYNKYRCIEDEPEILGELVIVDYKDVHGLGEGEGKSVVAPFTGLDEFGEYGDQVLMREGSGFAVCFGMPLLPMPDWPLWRVYDSAGHIRTLPVEDSQRWSVSHVEFDKSNSDPDAVIVTLENGNTFKANLRDTRVLADDEEAYYYYCYESARSDSIPEIIYKGVIDPNSNLEGVKKVVVFPGENEYPVFTIKREYKEVSVGSTSTIGKMNMYVADYIVREDGVNRVVPDNIVVTYKNENEPNAAPEIIPLAGMLNSASDLRNIDVFGKVYTYSRSYIADNIYYHETHVFCVPEAEKTLRHIVCHYASNSYDNQYLVLQFYGNGTRIWHMIVDREGNIRSLPVPDDRIGDVTRVYSVDLDADGGLDGYDPGDMIVTFASGETVTAKLSDTRVLTGKAADEYYNVYGG